MWNPDDPLDPNAVRNRYPAPNIGSSSLEALEETESMRGRRWGRYLSGRSFNGASDPFMALNNNLEGTNPWQMERQPIGQQALEPIRNYLALRRRAGAF